MSVSLDGYFALFSSLCAGKPLEKCDYTQR